VTGVRRDDSGCSNRTLNDTSAVADPYTGVCIWDSYDTSSNPYCGWGGTSLASPVVAASYALAGTPSSSLASSYPYANTAELHDVTSGTNSGNENGLTCTVAELCNAETGYDGPTGVGTPYGTGAYSPSQISYVSFARKTPYVVDDKGGSTSNGNPIQIWESTTGTTANEQWKAVSHGSYITIELARDTGKCLDVTGGGTANGTKVQLYSCNGNVDQEWRQLSGGQLEAVHATTVRGTTVVWDDSGNGGNGTRQQIWQANGNTQQQVSAP
jgi:hypothetical protein